jgi:hypothetical protein
VNCHPCSFTPPVPQAPYWTPQHITVAVLSALLVLVMLAVVAILIRDAVSVRRGEGS